MINDVLLYDATGTAIPPAGVVPPPTDFSVMPAYAEDSQDRYRGYFSRGLTPSRLANILEMADSGQPHDWFELCEEILEKDPKFGSLFQTRTAAVVGLTRDTMPPELDEAAPEADHSLADEIARFCGQALEAANFDELIGDIMDAVPKPFSVDWIYWSLDRDGKIVPVKFQRIPGTHLMWAVHRNELRLYDPAKYQVGADGETGEVLPPFCTVRALANPRRDNPLRSGLMRTLSWYYLFKVYALKDYMAYLDRFGMPLRIAKINSQQFKDEAFYNKVRSALRTVGSDGTGVFTNDTTLDVLASASKGGTDVFEGIINIVNREASQLVLGHELSSQSSPGAGQLGITAAIQVRQDYLEGDCNWVAGIIRRDVFRPLVEWNFGVDAVLRGLVPTLWFDYELPRDLKSEAEKDQILAKTFPDLEWSKQQVRDTYGIAEPLGAPEPADDVLMPSKPSPSPFGGGPAGPIDGALGPTSQPPELVNVGGGGSLPGGGNRATWGRPGGQNGHPGILARRRTRPTRYSPARQARITRLAARSVQEAAATHQAVADRIAGILRSVLADGGSYADARAQVIRSFKDLPVGQIETLLRQGLLLTRMAGRNGG